MAHILITSGPTRQYLDPVRYLTNASSGRMGAALAEAAIQLGHRVTIVSGPVQVEYPKDCELIPVVSTREMLLAAKETFPSVDGAIGAAAPCDYEPRRVAEQKLSKTGLPLQLDLIETPDVVAALGTQKRPDQWVVGFALETEDARFRSIAKMQKKCCDLMVSNGPSAIDAQDNTIEIFDPRGELIGSHCGSKLQVAIAIMSAIQSRLIDRPSERSK